MTRGPLPTPNKIKERMGNPNGHKIQKTFEPPSPNGIPDPPKKLNATGKKLWKKIADELYNGGILADMDYELLEDYCYQYQVKEQMIIDLSKEGFITLALGRQCRNAKWNIYLDCITKMEKAQAQLGIGAANRNRIPAKEISPKSLDDFYKELE